MARERCFDCVQHDVLFFAGPDNPEFRNCLSNKNCLSAVGGMFFPHLFYCMKTLFRTAALSSVVLLSAATAAQAQQSNRFTISGYVRDGATGESLPGVAVVHPASGQGTTTNTYGFYSLTLAPSTDSVKLLVSARGYERLRLAQPAGRSFTRDFRLKARPSWRAWKWWAAGRRK